MRRNNVFLVLFSITSIVLIGMQNAPVGFSLFAASALLLIFCQREFRRHMFLLLFGLLVLGITPIGTSTSYPEGTLMGLGLTTAVVVPYLITRYVYKSNAISFPSFKEKGMRWTGIPYLLFAALAAYLLLPVMLRSTESYHNWQIQPDLWNLAEAYIGLNFVGIWDELFFVCTVFALLSRFFPFWAANIAQAFVFTSFLYVVGFEGWSAIVIYIFALTQGYVFKRTKSLLYILAIHLTIDLVLHFVILYLHYPHLAPYFIT